MNATKVLYANLLSKKSLVLPQPDIYHPPSSLRRYELGFDSSANKYKVVCIYFEDLISLELILRAEVQTLGSNSWRVIQHVLPVLQLENKC